MSVKIPKRNRAGFAMSDFQRIKDVLTSELFLTYFDSKVELNLPNNASNVGIGAVLLQKSN